MNIDCKQYQTCGRPFFSTQQGLVTMATLASIAGKDHSARSLPASLVEDLQRVQKTAQKITSILDLDQLIDSVVDEITQTFGCLEAGIYLHDEEREEMVMACGLGPCYVCVRTFEVNGKKELRRVCIEGPVFDMQEAVGW